MDTPRRPGPGPAVCQTVGEDVESLRRCRSHLGALVLLLGLSLLLPPLAASAPDPSNRVYLPLQLGAARSSYWGVGACCGDETLLDPKAAAQVRASGAGWTRFGVQWHRVEPTNTTPDQFDWSYHDRLFAQATDLNLKVVAVLGSAPTWASDSRNGEGALRPGRLPDWIEYVEAVVDRYSKPPYNQHHWNVYNEPDGRSDVEHHVGQWGYNPLEYAALLKATHAAIHRVDPRARVIVTPAYEWFTDEGGLFVEDWLDAVLDPARGDAGDAFDVLGIHMYTYYRTRWASYGPDIAGKTRFLRSLLARYGVTKPMIVTEMGEAANLFGEPQVQARYLIKGTVRALAAGHQAVLWFSLTDFDPWERGLLTSELAPKPVLGAAQRLALELQRPVVRGEAGQRLALHPDVEGYYFDTPLGETLVIWLDREDEDARRTVLLPARVVRVSDRHASVWYVSDTDDGRTDGTVVLDVGREPLFLRVHEAAAQVSRRR